MEPASRTSLRIPAGPGGRGAAGRLDHPAPDREAHAEGMRRYLATGTPTILNKRIEIAVLHRDGREFPVELTVIPLHFGNDITFSAFLRDLTDQKRADEELRNSRTFLDSIVEHLPNMVFVKDAKELRFVRFNKAGEELLEVPEVELIGMHRNIG
jgi:PAS domain-containing protein